MQKDEFKIKDRAQIFYTGINHFREFSKVRYLWLILLKRFLGFCLKASGQRFNEVYDYFLICVV